VLQSVAACRSVLHCVAACCSVLQCVAVLREKGSNKSGVCVTLERGVCVIPCMYVPCVCDSMYVCAVCV